MDMLTAKAAEQLTSSTSNYLQTYNNVQPTIKPNSHLNPYQVNAFLSS